MSRQSRRAFLKLAAVSAAGVVATQVRASEPEFGFKTLGNGYQLANNRDSEGECGEGRCGGSMASLEKKATSEGKCGEGRCGGNGYGR